MLFSEMIISLTCLYTGFIYAVFYMYVMFQTFFWPPTAAYTRLDRLVQIFPAIFQGVYKFSPGMSGILFTMSMPSTPTSDQSRD